MCVYISNLLIYLSVHQFAFEDKDHLLFIDNSTVARIFQVHYSIYAMNWKKHLTTRNNLLFLVQKQSLRPRGMACNQYTAATGNLFLINVARGKTTILRRRVHLKSIYHACESKISIALRSQEFIL